MPQKERERTRYIRVLQNPRNTAQFSVELTGSGTDLFSDWMSEEQADWLARDLRKDLGILEEYVEERLNEPSPLPRREPLIAKLRESLKQELSKLMDPGERRITPISTPVIRFENAFEPVKRKK